MAGVAGVIAFVCGSASCLPDDLRAARALASPDLTVAVNAAATIVPSEHLATMHPRNAPGWLAQRAAVGMVPPVSLWCPPGSAPHDGWRHAPAWGGSSGLFGVAVAMELGADRIVLCGVPMDPTPHVDDAAPWIAAARYRYAWRVHEVALRASVRSLSGWTRGLLGAPTAAWLGVSKEGGGSVGE
jgi:hypothetical protein